MFDGIISAILLILGAISKDYTLCVAAGLFAIAGRMYWDKRD